MTPTYKVLKSRKINGVTVVLLQFEGIARIKKKEYRATYCKDLESLQSSLDKIFNPDEWPVFGQNIANWMVVDNLQTMKQAEERFNDFAKAFENPGCHIVNTEAHEDMIKQPVILENPEKVMGKNHEEISRSINLIAKGEEPDTSKIKDPKDKKLINDVNKIAKHVHEGALRVSFQQLLDRGFTIFTTPVAADRAAEIEKLFDVHVTIESDHTLSLSEDEREFYKLLY